MDDIERQKLLCVIERQGDKIAVFKQTVGALCLRLLGKPSEQLGPAQLGLFGDLGEAKVGPAWQAS